MPGGDNGMRNSIAAMFEEGLGKPSHRAKPLEEIMVPVRDGIRLRTLFFVPEGEGPWPVLFSRTPYPKLEEYLEAICEEYAMRGFACGFQFSRGLAGSEGIWEPYVNERNDGIDSVNWLAAQPWCEAIGIHGVSYMAFTGWIIADSLPAKVKGLFFCHYGTNRYLSMYKDGLFRHGISTAWAISHSGRKLTDDLNGDAYKASLYRPHADVFGDFWGMDVKWYESHVTNPDWGSDYWQKGVWKTLEEIPPKIDLPLCIAAGWFDPHSEDMLLSYDGLKDETKEKSHLIIGGWDHDFKPSMPEEHTRENAKIDVNVLMYDWFKNILVDRKTPARQIMTYCIGKDIWVERDNWPFRADNTVRLYFSGKWNDEESSFGLTDEPLPGTQSMTYVYDPQKPVHTVAPEMAFTGYEKDKSILLEAPRSRNDILSFVSGKFEDGITLSGRIKARIFVKSDCEDTAFTVKVAEVFSDGKAYSIRRGATTLAYRCHNNRREKYRPSDIVEIEIDMWPIMWSLKKGSRIRVDISSSDFPLYSVHPNTSGLWSRSVKTRKAQQTMFMGSEYRSFVELPVEGGGAI